MTRKQAYDLLYEKLSEIEGAITFEDDNIKSLELDKNDCLVILEHKGSHYDYELFIENKEGFTTVDIAILYKEVEDYKWCWKWLKTIGITEDIFQC